MIPERARARALTTAGTTLNRLGYELRPLSEDAMTPEERRRARLLNNRHIDVVLDIGANAGSYARQLRRIGFAGRVVSFEPLSEAFVELERAAQDDPLWTPRRLALGSADGTAEINVAGNSASSSLLDMDERHLQSAPEAEYVGTEEVEIARLDSVWPELGVGQDRVYLKLDVQGFELEVLRGASASLGEANCLQTELSFVQLYEGAPTYLEMIEYLGANGFRLAGLEEGHEDLATGEMLQADGIFVR